MTEKLDPVEQEIKEIMEQLTPAEQDQFIRDLEELPDDDEDDDFGEVKFFGYNPKYSTTKDFEFEE